MKSIVTALTALGLFSSLQSIQAQNTVSTGKVKGSLIVADKAIEGASVSILKAKDSSLVKMELTNKLGNFEIDQVKVGRYLVSIQSVGYKKYYSELFEVASNATYEIQKATLQLLDKQLKEVVVESKKPLIEQKIDRTVVNVEASVTNAGSTALEVLEKSPGISVDKDGNISLKGKQGVVILVDNKPTYLGGADLANMLRNMNSTQLEQIEIMTNPPAKYDAAGNSGVINIKTKKTKTKGLNGSFTSGYGQGIYPKTNHSLNMNYRNGKWNLFGNYSFGYREGFQNLDISRNFSDRNTKEIVSYFDQSATMNNISRNHNAKIGADFFASKKTIFGIVVTGFNSIGTGVSNNATNIFDKNYSLNSITKAITTTDENWKNYSSNFNFRHVFDSTGKELSADIDYVKYDATNFQSLKNSYQNGDGSFRQKGDTLDGSLPMKIAIYSGKIDYLHPLKKGAKLEAGAKFSYVETDNNARYDSLINNQYKPDYNRSNHFIYEEKIAATYVNFSKTINKKWAYQIGLRAEHTHAIGNQLGNVMRGASGFDTSYIQFFPTAYVTYTLNDKNQFTINYGRRIQRPNYEDLNPFVEFIDRYTFQQGNPGLRPQFSHNLELSHLFMGGLLSTTLNYTKVNNIIQQVLEQNTATNETFVRRANIAQLDQFGIAIAGQIPVQKWWSLNLYANGFNNRFRGIVNNAYVDFSTPTLQTNINNTFKLGKGWNTELSGFYRTKSIEGVMFIRSLGQISAGVSKTVLKNKGTVRLNVRDIFWLQQPKGYAKYDDIDVRFANRNDNRVINLSFSYRFSKGKMSNNNVRRKSALDEANRVQIGGN